MGSLDKFYEDEVLKALVFTILSFADIGLMPSREMSKIRPGFLLPALKTKKNLGSPQKLNP